MSKEEKRLIMYHHRAGYIYSQKEYLDVMERAAEYSYINVLWEDLEEIFIKDKTSISSMLNLKKAKLNILKAFDKYSLVKPEVTTNFLKARSMGRLEEKGVSSLADYGIDCNEENVEYINKYYNLLHKKIKSKFWEILSLTETLKTKRENMIKINSDDFELKKLK